MSEIQVYSAIGGENIASKSTPTSNNTLTTYVPSNAIDNNLDTFFHSACVGNDWIQLDFGATVPIAQIVIQNRSDGYQSRIHGSKLTLLDSSQNVTFTSDTFKDANGNDTYSDNGPAYKTFTITPPNTAVVGSNPNS